MKSIAKKIMLARKHKGYTQEELAEHSGVNVRTIQRIENCESEPRETTLRLICQALEIEMKEITKITTHKNTLGIGKSIIEGFFLLALNLVLMSILGFLTLDASANLNSRFGAILLSFFLSMFIVMYTPKMGTVERMLKFGFGFFVYFVLALIMVGFPIGFTSGLFPSLLIAVSVLYYGDVLLIKHI